MRFNNLHRQYSGLINSKTPLVKMASNDALGSLVSDIPNGIVGGAAAGNIMALLLGRQSTRNIAAKVTGYGGVALLSGLAYKAYKSWELNKLYVNTGVAGNEAPVVYDKGMIRKSLMTQDFEIKLIKVMIASAKADGSIDSAEQRRIFQAIDHMDLSIEIRAALFNLLNKPIDIEAITRDVEGIQQKSELYLSAYLIANPDHAENKRFTDQLAASLGLPEDLQQQINYQANHGISELS